MDFKTITGIKKTPSNGRFCIAECHRNVRKLSGVRECSRYSEQNLQFPFSIFIASSIKCRTEPGSHRTFMGEGGVSLPNVPILGRSVQRSMQSLRISGADHAAFPGRSNGFLSLSHFSCGVEKEAGNLAMASKCPARLVSQNAHWI